MDSLETEARPEMQAYPVEPPGLNGETEESLDCLDQTGLMADGEMKEEQAHAALLELKEELGSKVTRDTMDGQD